MELTRVEKRQFSADIESLIKSAEQNRLRFMRAHRSREVMSSILGLLSITAGVLGFGWFFLMQADLLKGIVCIVLGIVVPLTLDFWADGPIKDYIADHKKTFMPRMAKALGGFKFHPARGISSKILARTGVIPSFDTYKAEDCFMGRYKGVKVIFSEARLHKKNRANAVFDGIFVLLETPDDMFEGHTIVTSNHALIERYRDTRWAKFSDVNIQTTNPSWERFEIYSDKPESASLLAGEKLLKELAEASDIFDSSPLSAVFFKGKYIFLAIPYEKDMFEASNIYIPVTTKKHALECKREIEQILEIIDVFEIYRTDLKSAS